MYTFGDILGHEDIKEHFKNAIKLSKISHAYLISGEKGMGKRLLAYTFAKALQCEEHREEPCNECTSCKLFDSHNHPDIIRIQSTKLKSIGVEDIRQQLNHDIYIKPYRFRYKIYIIDEAEKLTDQAQNAMLKTIEEPPEYAIIFLLTTNSHKILPTIVSRCVTLNLKPISKDSIQKYLIEQHNITNYEADFYVAFSQGIVGRAKELVESEEFNHMRRDCISLLNKIQLNSTVDILEEVTRLDKYKDNIQELLDMMLTWYRDMLIVKATRKEKGLIHKDQFNSLLKQGSFLTYNKIGRNIKTIESTKQQLSYNVNFQLNLEALLLKIKES